MEFRSSAKYVRVSPQKARLVLDLIKGRRVEDAMNTLTFTKKGIAPNVQKVLRSAIENANYLSTEKGVDVDVAGLRQLRHSRRRRQRVGALPGRRRPPVRRGAPRAAQLQARLRAPRRAWSPGAWSGRAEPSPRARRC